MVTVPLSGNKFLSCMWDSYGGLPSKDDTEAKPKSFMMVKRRKSCLIPQKMPDLNTQKEKTEQLQLTKPKARHKCLYRT